MKSILKRVLIALLFCANAALPAHAQSWPARPITLIIGFGGGGSGEVVAHVFGEFASKELGQPVIVENRPGGGGAVAAIDVSRARPDGYTIALHLVGPMIVRPILDPAIGYDAEKDFSPIGLLADTPNVILAGPKFFAGSMQAMVDWARKNPGHLTIGHPGVGTMGHLGALLLASKAGITGTYIAYRGGPQILPDLMGGQIDAACAAYSPTYKAAQIMAVMAPERVAFLPDVPSMAQAGFPGVYASTWYGLFGPPNLPPEIVAKLNGIMNSFLHSDEARKRFALLGFQALGGPPQQLTKKIADDKVLWAKVIKDANIKMNNQQ